MSLALKILTEETPKEFFKRQGMRGTANLTEPVRFKNVSIGCKFTRSGGSRFVKKDEHTAVGMDDGRDIETWKGVLCYPCDWSEIRCTNYLTDLVHDRVRVTGESLSEETPREFFKRHKMRQLPLEGVTITPDDAVNDPDGDCSVWLNAENGFTFVTLVYRGHRSPWIACRAGEADSDSFFLHAETRDSAVRKAVDAFRRAQAKLAEGETPKEFFKRHRMRGDVPSGYRLVRASDDATLQIYRDGIGLESYVASVRPQYDTWRYCRYGEDATGRVLCFTGSSKTKREAVDAAIKAWHEWRAVNPDRD